MQLSISELKISLYFHNFGSLELPVSYNKFLDSEFRGGDARFSFYSCKNIPKSRGNKIFSTSIWNICECRDKYYLRISYPDTAYPPPRVGIFSKDFSEGKIYCPIGFNQPLYTPLDQIVVTNFLTGKGLLIHACGIGVNNKGYLFVGQSGKGKTTIAELSKKIGAKVLSDDRVIIRILKGRVYIFGTPWHGDFAEISNDSFILKKMFFLTHGKENKVVPVSNLNAVYEIIRHSFPPFWNKRAVDFSLSFSESIVKKIEVYKLIFRKDLNIESIT